jgi:hypothetical protein
MTFLFVSQIIALTLFACFGIGERALSSSLPSIELPLLARTKSTPLKATCDGALIVNDMGSFYKITYTPNRLLALLERCHFSLMTEDRTMIL